MLGIFNISEKMAVGSQATVTVELPRVHAMVALTELRFAQWIFCTRESVLGQGQGKVKSSKCPEGKQAAGDPVERTISGPDCEGA